MDLTDLQVKLLQLNKAKDGDVLVIKSDDIDQETVTSLVKALKKVCNKKIAVIGMDADSDLQLIEASEARAILEKLAKG